MIDLQKKLDAPTLLLLGGIVFWVALYAFIGPQPFGGDGFYFKDVAINFINGMGFKEISGPGNPTLTEYKYYATYPPVYPLLYAIYAFVFGIGDYQNTYFNLLLQIVRTVLLFIIIVKYGTDWTPSQKLIITIGLIMCLPHAQVPDRPEDLVIVLFLMSLLFYLRGHHEIAFLIAGLNLMTSHVCGLISAVILLWIYFHDAFRERVELKKVVAKSYPTMYMLVFPVIIIAFLALLDLSIFERYYNFATYISSERTIAAFIIKSFFSTYSSRHPVLFFDLYFNSILILILCALLFLYAYWLKEKRLALFMILMIFSVVTLYLLAKRFYYLFLLILSILIGIYVIMRNVERLGAIRKRVFLIYFGLVFLAVFPKIARDIYLRAVPMNRENYELSKQMVQTFLKDKNGNLVMSSPMHYFMVKNSSVVTVVHYEYLSKGDELPKYIVVEPLPKGFEHPKGIVIDHEQDSIASFTPKPIPLMCAPKVEKSYLYRKVFETEKSVPNPQNTFWERLLMRPYDTWYPVIYERIDEQ